MTWMNIIERRKYSFRVGGSQVNYQDTTRTQRNHNARHQEDKQNDSLISLITDSYTFHIVDT